MSYAGVFIQVATLCGFYPYASWGRDICPRRVDESPFRVSLRAPWAGRDLLQRVDVPPGLHVSIRTPWAGRDAVVPIFSRLPVLFLSARPGRGATLPPQYDDRDLCVSIRTPRAGRDPYAVHQVLNGIPVSIRTPRAGRDIAARIAHCIVDVSIRTPRAGRDGY